MTDLNEWRLAYPGCNFTFGTAASDYPFKTQVDIGDVATDVQDQQHPSSDGMVMGLDSMGGFTLGFDITTIPGYPQVDDSWTAAFDLASSFKAKWRADTVRRQPGVYASLLNVNRNRLVYGRPRKASLSTARARKGEVGLVATFQTNGPDFYSGTEKVALLNAAAPTGGGFKNPLVPPFSSAVGQASLATTNNYGDVATWPVIRFRGPGSDFSLECFLGTEVVWKMVVTDRLKADQTLTVDTRPWSRSATINGDPANGRIKGTQLEYCKIPVGDFNLRFRVKDPTGQSFADVKWRDAYASL